MKLFLIDTSKLPVRVGDVLEVISVANGEVAALLVHRPVAPPAMSPPTLGVSVGDGAHVMEALR